MEPKAMIDEDTAREYAAMLTRNRRPFAALRLMLGTSMIFRTGNGIRFDLHGGGRFSLCELSYNAGDDLFEIRFYRGGKVAETLTMLWGDQLTEVFERHSGLRITVPRICGINA